MCQNDVRVNSALFLLVEALLQRKGERGRGLFACQSKQKEEEGGRKLQQRKSGKRRLTSVSRREN